MPKKITKYISVRVPLQIAGINAPTQIGDWSECTYIYHVTMSNGVDRDVLVWKNDDIAIARSLAAARRIPPHTNGTYDYHNHSVSYWEVDGVVFVEEAKMQAYYEQQKKHEDAQIGQERLIGAPDGISHYKRITRFLEGEKEELDIFRSPNVPECRSLEEAKEEQKAYKDYMSGENYFNQDEFEDAILSYNSAYNVSSKKKETYREAKEKAETRQKAKKLADEGDIQYNKFDYESAKSKFEEALKISKQKKDKELYKAKRDAAENEVKVKEKFDNGEKYYNKGNYKLAKECYESAIGENEECYESAIGGNEGDNVSKHDAHKVKIRRKIHKADKEIMAAGKADKAWGDLVEGLGNENHDFKNIHWVLQHAKDEFNQAKCLSEHNEYYVSKMNDIGEQIKGLESGSSGLDLYEKRQYSEAIKHYEIALEKANKMECTIYLITDDSVDEQIKEEVKQMKAIVIKKTSNQEESENITYMVGLCKNEEYDEVPYEGGIGNVEFDEEKYEGEDKFEILDSISSSVLEPDGIACIMPPRLSKEYISLLNDAKRENDNIEEYNRGLEIQTNISKNIELIEEDNRSEYNKELKEALEAFEASHQGSEHEKSKKIYADSVEAIKSRMIDEAEKYYKMTAFKAARDSYEMSLKEQEIEQDKLFEAFKNKCDRAIKAELSYEEAETAMETARALKEEALKTDVWNDRVEKLNKAKQSLGAAAEKIKEARNDVTEIPVLLKKYGDAANEAQLGVINIDAELTVGAVREVHESKGAIQDKHNEIEKYKGSIVTHGAKLKSELKVIVDDLLKESEQYKNASNNPDAKLVDLYGIQDKLDIQITKAKNDWDEKCSVIDKEYQEIKIADFEEYRSFVRDAKDREWGEDKEIKKIVKEIGEKAEAVFEVINEVLEENKKFEKSLNELRGQSKQLELTGDSILSQESKLFISKLVNLVSETKKKIEEKINDRNNEIESKLSDYNKLLDSYTDMSNEEYDQIQEYDAVESFKFQNLVDLDSADVSDLKNQVQEYTGIKNMSFYKSVVEQLAAKKIKNGDAHVPLFGAHDIVQIVEGEKKEIWNKASPHIFKCLMEEVVLTDEQRSKDEIFVVIGNTGVGKSTTLNYLMGNKMTIRDSKGGGAAPLKLECDDSVDISQQMQIGSSNLTSCTTKPSTKFGNGIRFIDLPGYGDTKGFEQKVINVRYISKLLDGAQKVRFGLVTSQAEIAGLEDRGVQMATLFKEIRKAVTAQNIDGKIPFNIIINKATPLEKPTPPEHLLTKPKLYSLWMANKRPDLLKQAETVRREKTKEGIQELLKNHNLDKVIKIDGMRFIDNVNTPSNIAKFRDPKDDYGDYGDYGEEADTVQKIDPVPSILHDIGYYDSCDKEVEYILNMKSTPVEVSAAIDQTSYGIMNNELAALVQQHVENIKFTKDKFDTKFDKALASNKAALATQYYVDAVNIKDYDSFVKYTEKYAKDFKEGEYKPIEWSVCEILMDFLEEKKDFGFTEVTKRAGDKMSSLKDLIKVQKLEEYKDFVLEYIESASYGKAIYPENFANFANHFRENPKLVEDYSIELAKDSLEDDETIMMIRKLVEKDEKFKETKAKILQDKVEEQIADDSNIENFVATTVLEEEQKASDLLGKDEKGEKLTVIDTKLGYYAKIIHELEEDYAGLYVMSSVTKVNSAILENDIVKSISYEYREILPTRNIPTNLAITNIGIEGVGIGLDSSVVSDILSDTTNVSNIAKHSHKSCVKFNKFVKNPSDINTSLDLGIEVTKLKTLFNHFVNADGVNGYVSLGAIDTLKSVLYAGKEIIYGEMDKAYEHIGEAGYSIGQTAATSCVLQGSAYLMGSTPVAIIASSYALYDTYNYFSKLEAGNDGCLESSYFSDGELAYA